MEVHTLLVALSIAGNTFIYEVFVLQMKDNLKIVKCLRFSQSDINLMNELKRLKIKPTSFIRQAFREKIKSDFSKLLIEENKKLTKQYCPF